MSVGSELAAARVAAQLTIEDVARQTRVRAGLLRQIEADDFSGCGGDVYARGHIKSVAAALQLDTQPFLDLFSREQHSAVPSTVMLEPTFVPETTSKRALKARTGPNWLAYAVAAAGVATVFIGVASFGGGSKAPAGALSQTAPTTVASTAPSVAPSVAPSAPADDTNLTASTGVDIQMAVASQASWVSVTDGVSRTKLFEGILAPGSSREFKSDAKIVFTLGNAGAVTLTVNGRNIGSPGSLGQVVNQTYGPGDPATQTQG